MPNYVKYFIYVFVAIINLEMVLVGVHKVRPSKGYGYNLAVSADEFLNALIGGFPGETVSSRAARARNNGKNWGCFLCKWLDKLHTDHCTKSLAMFESLGIDTDIYSLTNLTAKK